MLPMMTTHCQMCNKPTSQLSRPIRILQPTIKIHHPLRLLATICLWTILFTFHFGENVQVAALSAPLPQIGINNLTELRVVRSIQGPTDGIAAIALSLDGTTLAYGSYSDHHIYLVDPLTGDLRLTLTGSGNHVTELAFSPDHRLLASWAKDDEVRLWDVQTGKEMATIALDQIRKLLFNQDGTQLLIARVSTPAQVVVWDIRSQAEVKRIDHVFLGVSLSPNGSYMAAGGRNNGLHLIDMASAQTEELHGHEGWVTATAFDSTGNFIATGSDDRTIRLWERATGQVQRSFTGPESEVDFVSFSPDGALLVSLDSGMNIKRLPGGQVEVSMSMTHKTRVARFWHVETGEQIHLLEDEGPASITSPLIAAGR